MGLNSSPVHLQPIFDIAEICAQHGINNAILCPGSRNAPLTLGFSRHPDINSKTISDERSAAFIALGIAQATQKTVVLNCTSGSAVYNFAPAVAEAYYQHVPLLIFTADRPKEWIDQLDGQSIRQTNIYGNHVKQSFELPEDYDHPDSVWFINRIINEAINLSNRFPKGPVHINVPLREPLYPSKEEILEFSKSQRIIREQVSEPQLHPELLTSLKSEFLSFTKILIVAGQQPKDETLSNALTKFSNQHNIPVVGDIISNQHNLEKAVRHADVLFGQCRDAVKKVLKPELLVTFGNSVISKNLKTYLRAYKPLQHWHLQPNGKTADTFQSLSHVLAISPVHFFEQLTEVVAKSGFDAQKRENYFRLWEVEEHRTKRAIDNFFTPPQLNEFYLVSEVLKNLPENTQLHLANSMSIRYANFIGLASSQKNVRVFSNRGTSGIDGCTSTAVGHALTSADPVVLITGDMATLYDRNAFWHNYKLPNFRMVVLNNHGGAIFSMIDGPGNLPEAESYFITQQKLTAKAIATEYDFDYLKLDNLKKLKNLLKDLFDFDGRTKIMEFESSHESAKKTLDEFKKQIKDSYDT